MRNRLKDNKKIKKMLKIDYLLVMLKIMKGEFKMKELVLMNMKIIIINMKINLMLM